MKRTKVLVGLVLAGVFVLGVLTGGGLALVGVRRKARSLLDGPPEHVEPRALVFAMNRALDLSEEQRDRVMAIALRHQPEINARRRAIEPELAAIRAQAKDEIRATLTPRQQAKFDVMALRFEQRRKRMLGMAP
jgi:hypothetical protein